MERSAARERGVIAKAAAARGRSITHVAAEEGEPAESSDEPTEADEPPASRSRKAPRKAGGTARKR